MDTRFVCNLVRVLPKPQMQAYHGERNADPNFKQGYTLASQANEPLLQHEEGHGEIKMDAKRTSSDIFGKKLDQFPRRVEIDEEQAPLIFWLIAGYFRAQPERFKTLGLFRVTSSDQKLRILELHLSQGNLEYLREVKDAHLIANHCKRTLREM